MEAPWRGRPWWNCRVLQPKWLIVVNNRWRGGPKEKKRNKNKQGSQTSPSITQKQCQPVTPSASYIFMHSKHKGWNPSQHMLRDPAESFYGVMSSRPIVINEPPHLHALPVNKFPRWWEGWGGGQGGRDSVTCPHPRLYCALGGHEIIAMQRAARFPFLILRVNSILIQF